MPHGIIVFGASGSGTSTIGKELASTLGYTHFDIDDYFWAKSDVPFTVKRSRDERMAKLLTDITAAEAFVMSGSMLDWSEPFEPYFELAVNVETPTGVRLERLEKREYERFGDRILEGGNMYEAHRDFIDWAATYDTAGLEKRSKMSHEQWANTLTCAVIKVDGTKPVREIVDEIQRLIIILINI